MRKISLLLTLGFWTAAQVLLAQNSVNDDFSDGNFTSNPSWIGQDSLFTVNAANQLQLNDTGAISSNSYLVTPSTAINSSSWEFYVKLDFAPSGTNFSKVYLVSDNQDLTQNLNGYFVRIGGQSGTVDDVSLYRQDGSTEVKLIDGTDGTVAVNPEVKVKVTKNASNQWELFLDQTAGGTSFVSEGTAVDNTYGTSSFFGVFCRYTSSRSNKFFFDDILVSGISFQDTIKPVITNVSVISNTILRVSFNEKVDSATALNTSNYTVNKNIGNPATIQFSGSDSLEVQLQFSNSFSNGEDYQLITKNVEDKAGNKMENDSLGFMYFVPVATQYRDLVINELYPDPSSSNGLPNAEFVELFNASTKIIDLSGWTLTDGSSTATLSTQLLRPNEFIILCPTSNEQSFSSYGLTQGQSNFPTLNNSGDNIQLFNDSGELIDFVNYTTEWYKNDAKDGGGYSLEQINPSTPCTGINNFTASNATLGGTPGSINSVFDTSPDSQSPVFTKATILSSDSILLEFDEFLDSTSVAGASYIFNPSILVDTAIAIRPAYQSILLLLDTPLDSGVIYALTLDNVKDCAGNIVADHDAKFIALPDKADANDVVINEVLFNPRSGGADFVELFNRSNKVISLKNWQVANEQGDSIANKKLITEEELIILPKSYLVITEDKQNIIDEYPNSIADNIYEINDLPSYNDDEGSVYIFNTKQLLIDAVSYEDDLQFDLLQSDEGVSLERISSERPSSDKTNFHSAAESVGFATPGFKNSQAFDGISFNGKITVEPEIISPDNDGFQDVLNINYQFSAPGYVASVSVYDRNGRLIKQLVKNELLGSKGTFSWDGTTDENTKARIGIYIILVEAFNTSGDKEIFKEVITVAGFID